MIFEYPHATVESVHDGDTFWARIDLGARLTWRMRVRLYRVSAAELDEPGGPEARDALAKLLVPGTAVRLTSHEWSYDRIVCVVMSGSTDVGATMVFRGFAQADDR